MTGKGGEDKSSSLSAAASSAAASSAGAAAAAGFSRIFKIKSVKLGDQPHYHTFHEHQKPTDLTGKGGEGYRPAGSRERESS